MGNPSENRIEWYREAYRAIRPFVNFRLSLKPPFKASKHFRALIRQHYDWVRNYTASGSKPVHIYRSRNIKNLRLAQEQAGMEIPNRFAVAFFPGAEGGKTRIRVRNGRVIIKTKMPEGDIHRELIPLAEYEEYDGQLMEAPEDVIRNAVEQSPDFEAYTIQCGEHDSKITYDNKDMAGKVVAQYFEEYDNAREWLRGIIGYRFDSQATFDEYLAKRKALRQNRKRRVRAKKRKDTT